MKDQFTRLSQKYVTALRKHLKGGPGASFQSALNLGRQAVALRLETLELARIHQQAVATLGLSRWKNGIIKRAAIFFSEAITPIVETHRAARQARHHLTRLSKTLAQRTVELASKNRQLLRG